MSSMRGGVSVEASPHTPILREKASAGQEQEANGNENNEWEVADDRDTGSYETDHTASRPDGSVQSDALDTSHNDEDGNEAQSTRRTRKRDKDKAEKKEQNGIRASGRASRRDTESVQTSVDVAGMVVATQEENNSPLPSDAAPPKRDESTRPKRKSADILLSTPSPNVPSHVKESTLSSLPQSRSGRKIVPPLAFWANQV